MFSMVPLSPGARLPANRYYPGYEEYADYWGLDHHLYDTREEAVFIYELLGTTAQFHRPAGIYHFIKAYRTRNLADCLLTPICETNTGEGVCQFSDSRKLRKTKCPIGNRWISATTALYALIAENLLSSKYTKRIKRAEWADGMKGAMKKARARDANELRAEGTLTPKSDIFLKGDEVLYPRPDGLKGRLIKAVNPTIQSETGVQVLRAMKRLKRVFNEKVSYHVNGWQFSFAVGSGRTAAELDHWFAVSIDFVRTQSSRVAAIFAGDDLYILSNVDGTILVVENDMSKMDRTNGVHALGSEAYILERFGVKTRSVNLLFQSMFADAVFVEKALDYKTKIKMPIQRATGAADTTFGNTWASIVAAFRFLATRKSVPGVWEDYAPAIAEVGFEGKTQVMPFGYEGTFLKGWWIPDTNGEARWMPLPSQVIKLGKIKTYPGHIYPNCPLGVAWTKAAVAIAKGVGAVPISYPILGPFVHRLLDLEAKVQGPVEMIREQEHKIFREECDFAFDKEVVAIFAKRYGISFEEVVRVELLFLGAPFPARLHDQVFFSLADRDYG